MMERYQKMIRRRRVSAIIFMLLGIAVLGLLLVSRPLPRFMDSFLFGTGFAALASGVVNLHRKSVLLRDENALRKAATQELDERNIEVQRRSYALALDIMLIVLYIAMVASAFISRMVCFTLLAVLCTGLALMFICYQIVWRTI